MGTIMQEKAERPMARRRFLAAAGAGAAAWGLPRAPHLGMVVFCEKRPYGTVVCGSKATMLIGRHGCKLFGPEVER
jgi:hypothetical protein